jgi:hypothetical protein
MHASGSLFQNNRTMTVKNQKPNLRPKSRSTSFLIWVISGFYLLAMIWLLLSATGHVRHT